MKNKRSMKGLLSIMIRPFFLVGIVFNSVAANAACINIEIVGTTNPTTCSANDGTMTFKITLVTMDCPPCSSAVFKYQIDNNAAVTFTPDNDGTTVMSLSSGNHTLKVFLIPSGANQTPCTMAETPFTIGGPPGFTIDTSGVTRSNCDNNTGKFTITVTGGSPGYTVTANNLSKPITMSGGSATFENLSPTTYTVLVTDSQGCTKETEVEIEPAVEVSVSLAAPKAVTCNGGNDGSVIVTQPAAGTSGYSYSISPNATFNNNTNEFTGLSAGNYTITVIHTASHCSASKPVEINEPEPIDIEADVTNVTCKGLNDGKINISVQGGNGGFEYDWSNNATTQNLTGLAPGAYSITVTDNKDCTGTASAVVAEPTALDFTVQPSDNPIASGQQLNILLTGTNDVDFFTWQITDLVNINSTPLSGNVSNNSNIVKILTLEGDRSPGLATFQIQPFYSPTCKGDSQLVSITVVPAAGDAPFIPEIYTPNGDGVNDEWNLVLPDGVEVATIAIYNRLGGKVYEGNATVPWNGNGCPDGPYFFVLEYTQNQEVKVVKGAVTILRTTE